MMQRKRKSLVSMARGLLLRNSNLSRALFDFVVLSLAASVAILFGYIYTGVTNLGLLLAPCLGLLVNYIIGIYGQFRIASGVVKTTLLTLSLALVGSALVFLTHDVPGAVLCCVVSWGPLVLPRLFLNLNRRASGKPISHTLSRVIKGGGPVLVVGGGGYIGTHVVSQLLEEGYGVRVLDSLFYGRDSLSGFLNNPKFELIEGDVADISKLVKATEGAYAVIHLAGLVGDPACALDENFTLHSNIIITRMLKEVAISAGIQRFIFASSCSVYGASDEIVDETSGLNPVSLYAKTKIESERELLASVSDEFFVTILRFATVFGHSRRPRFDLVGNLFTAQAFNDRRITVFGGDQWRPFIHVADIARAIVMTLKADPFKVQAQVLNVGDDKLNMTISDLAEKVKSVAEKGVVKETPVSIISSGSGQDRRNYNTSFSKIKRLLGFTAKYSIEDGVLEMLNEFKKGSYANYKEPKFSNLEVTKQTSESFKDPKNSENLYRPYSVTSIS